MDHDLDHDFHLLYDGSLVLLDPVSEAAQTWVGEHLPEDAQHFGPFIVIEPRFLADIVRGFTEAGLTHRGRSTN